MTIRSIYRCLGLGATCGLRSMTGPAVTRWRAGDPLRLLFAALAAGELIADKLPATPARTIPPAIAFRAISGAYTAGSFAAAVDGERVGGAVAGALAAVAAAYVGMALRGAIGRTLRLPDPIVALAEDALAVGGALALSRA